MRSINPLLIALIFAMLSSCTREVSEPDITLLDYEIAYTNASGISFLSFSDSDNGMVWSKTGYILKTTNGGRNWDTTAFPPTICSGVICLSPSITYLYTLSDHSFFHRTGNGGNSWTYAGPFDDNLLMSFYTPTEGYAFARPWGSFLSNGIMHSTDAGANWTYQATNMNLAGQMRFVNANEGYGISSNGEFLRTVNGGLNWSIKHSDCKYFSRMSNSGKCFLITSENRIYKTTDFGVTWNLCFSDPAGSWFGQIDFSDEGLVVAGAANGAVLVSYDEGLTWKYMQLKGETSMTNYLFREVALLSNNVCVVTGNYDNSWFIYRITLPQE
jgi:photosystem II stability/assembly factor-like uncharacterized protein